MWKWSAPLVTAVDAAHRTETAHLSTAERLDTDAELRAQFDTLAEELLLDAAGVSVPRRLAGHPAYLGILALGDRAIPLLVERLETGEGRPVWLTLLGSLTGFQPGAGRQTIREAAEDWIAWSRHNVRLV
jgi:hypothetical protein